MTKRKQTNKNANNLPATLWGFYLRYAFRGHYLLICTSFILILLVSFDRIVQPLAQQWTVAIFENAPAPGQSFIEHALPTILLIIVLNLAVTLTATLRDWTFSIRNPSIHRRISEFLTAYVHSQSMTFWTGRMAGQVNSQMNYMSDGFDVINHIWMAFCRLLTILINSAILFSVNRYVAYLFVGIIVFRAFYAWKMRKPLKEATKNRSSVISTISGKLIDSISNYSVVKVFARASAEEKYLAPARTERINAVRRVNFLHRLFYAIPGALWDILLGVTILLCAILFMYGEMTVAQVVFTTSVYFTVMGTISGLIDMMPNIIDKWASAARAYEELIVPISVMDAPNAPELIVRCGTIEFRNVSFRYKRKWVLRDLNLKIKCGERVGIVGPSGAGKTTLVHLLMRFWDPTHGQILIDGQDIKSVTQDSLRENIAFIPQDPTMFNRTLRENIGYGKVDATDAQIRQAAKRAAAHEFIMGTDQKYNSLVGDRGIKLSGGQRQRIAIARAFLKDAPILVLDEATSALDSETEVAIQKSFDELATGRTTVAIAHRLSTLRNMDRIIVIKDCHVIEQGSHQSLLRKRGEYARLWKMQSGGFLQE